MENLIKGVDKKAITDTIKSAVSLAFEVGNNSHSTELDVDEGCCILFNTSKYLMGNNVNKYFSCKGTRFTPAVTKDTLLYVKSGNMSVTGESVYRIPDEKQYYFINKPAELTFHEDTVFFSLSVEDKQS